MARRRKASAADLAELGLGKGSKRDRAEARLGSYSKRVRSGRSGGPTKRRKVRRKKR